LFEELDRLTAQLQDLIQRINRTNLQAQLADGRSVTEALARRDILVLRQSVLGQTVEAASERHQRYGRAEIRILSTVDIAGLRRQVDDLSRERRELDAAIQETNWSVDVID
jgi:hypothetical protein